MTMAIKPGMVLIYIEGLLPMKSHYHVFLRDHMTNYKHWISTTTMLQLHIFSDTKI